jgi:hypothetical protein
LSQFDFNKCGNVGHRYFKWCKKYIAFHIILNWYCKLRGKFWNFRLSFKTKLTFFKFSFFITFDIYCLSLTSVILEKEKRVHSNNTWHFFGPPYDILLFLITDFKAFCFELLTRLKRKFLLKLILLFVNKFFFQKH